MFCVFFRPLVRPTRRWGGGAAPLGLTSKPLGALGPACPSASLELAGHGWAKRLFFFRGEVCSFLWTGKHITSFTSFCFCNRFIEVYFTHQKQLPLLVHNALIFSDFAEWHSHFHKWVSEHFHPLVRTLVLVYCVQFHPSHWPPHIHFLSLGLGCGGTLCVVASGFSHFAVFKAHPSQCVSGSSLLTAEKFLGSLGHLFLIPMAVMGTLRPSGGGHWLLEFPVLLPRSVFSPVTGLSSPPPLAWGLQGPTWCVAGL